MLERLTWKEGYFVNEKGEIVEPLPLGAPITLIVRDDIDLKEKISSFFEEEIKKDKLLSERVRGANAYCLGTRISALSTQNDSVCAETFQLYKI